MKDTHFRFNLNRFKKPDIKLTRLPRVRRFPFYTMEGEFTVEYLGCSVLSKATTSGLGSIQKPLRDKYIEFRKNSKSKKQSQTVGLKVSRDGLFVMFPGSLPGQANQMYYDFPSINYFEAVRFIAMKGADKKIAAGFLPIDQNIAPISGSDKLFTHLEKKHQHLAKLQHPAMLACVMRRTSGVRMLESHFFVTENEGEALQICSCLHSHMHGPEPEPPFSNRYGSDIRYPPPENYGMHRHDSDRRSDSGSSGRPAHLNFSDDPAHIGDRHSGGWDPRRDTEGPDYQRNYERPPYRGPPGGPNDPYSRHSGDENRIYHERQRSGELNRYPDDRGPYQRPNDNRYVHERQPSDDDRGYQGQGGIIRGDRHPAERYSRPQNREDPEGRYPRVTSPGRYNDPPMTAPKPNRALSPGPYQQQSPRSPRSPMSPRSGGLPRHPYEDRPTPSIPREQPVMHRPPPTHTEPFYSASNLESRQEQTNKPVAKVPPHLVAGVRVLPMGLKEALPKKIAAEPSRYDDDEEDPYDNAVSRKDFYANKDYRKNIKSEGDRRDYNDSKEYRKKPDVIPQNENNWDVKEDYDDDIYRKNSSRTHDANRFSEPIVENNNKPWSFQGEMNRFNKGSSFDRGSHDDDVSDMFSKLNVHRVGHDGPQPSNTDFEEELGYLP